MECYSVGKIREVTIADTRSLCIGNNCRNTDCQTLSDQDKQRVIILKVKLNKRCQIINYKINLRQICISGIFVGTERTNAHRKKLLLSVFNFPMEQFKEVLQFLILG